MYPRIASADARSQYQPWSSNSTTPRAYSGVTSRDAGTEGHAPAATTAGSDAGTVRNAWLGSAHPATRVQRSTRLTLRMKYPLDPCGPSDTSIVPVSFRAGVCHGYGVHCASFTQPALFGSSMSQSRAGQTRNPRTG